MIFQDLDAALNPKMTVGELLREAITLQKPLPREDVLRRSEELLGSSSSSRRSFRPILPISRAARSGGSRSPGCSLSSPSSSLPTSLFPPSTSPSPPRWRT
jgi:ABC-type glutathione transport system ATPase component